MSLVKKTTLRKPKPFHASSRNSWDGHKTFSVFTLDFDGGAPPEQAWRRRLNSHANILKEFSVTFMEAIKMMHLGIRLWSYVRKEASQGRRAPIDPFTRERCMPSASLGVPLGGMGSGSISRGFRGEFKNWQIIPGSCELSPVMANQFSVMFDLWTANDNPHVTFAIAACETQNVSVTVLPSFGLSGESCVTARHMWGSMVQDGCFDWENFNACPCMPSLPGETLCAAVSASTWVEPHGKCTVAFALAWSSPKVKFLKGRTYHRRYTKFYGTSERSAVDLVHDALTNLLFCFWWWEEEIEKWQSPILKDERLPEWYKFTLFNELYFLVAGGTVWMDGGSIAEENTNQHNSTMIMNGDARIMSTENSSMDLVAEHGAACTGMENADANGVPGSLISQDDSYDVGKFLYLEGVEYVMWCTYDVYFDASFALLCLFPKIELSIQRDFARAVLFEDRRKVKFLASGTWGIRKVKGAVPHDLGMHDHWHEMNAYNIYDTSRWKDLNCKFVLQVYRDFAATGDMSFGRDIWPAVCAAMEYMEQFDRDGDGLIENDGFPYQTCDTRTTHGVSAYCGCLWLASLQAAAAMAHHVGDTTSAEKFQIKFLKAKPVFEAKLWNGSYFNYDSGMSRKRRSIQADQLAGQLLFDDTKIRSTLQKIYDFNVMKVAICELPFHPISSEVLGGVGGTCVIRGCVSKKILVYVASFRGEFEDARNFGWELNEQIDFNWKKLLLNKTQEIIRLNGVYKRLLSSAGVTMLEGEGKIIGAHAVEVTKPDGSKQQYSARHILIATGSRALRVNIPGKLLRVHLWVKDLPQNLYFPRFGESGYLSYWTLNDRGIGNENGAS
ncbi:hypothetical protein COCNU_04G003170 [Cocos nucifera]|uniref:Non-lysosomal glucosylceramidase n=1 Tax=Cocos nucifera TaxID=13894 RepID=A0A8K0I535_COCNU|nr:hypothetical protein COCNU_04G003170 [Cocos nucifera]